MGKRIIGVIAFAAIAVAAGWNYQQNTNAEALADPEIEVGVPCIMTSQTCYEINDDLGHTVIPGYK